MSRRPVGAASWRPAGGLAAALVVGLGLGFGAGGWSGLATAGQCRVGAAWAGPLAEKAAVFDALIERDHAPHGLVHDVALAADGTLVRAHGGGDACIWTGAWAASQVYRYRATGDPRALANVERVMRAFHTLQAVTGYPGFVARTFGEPRWLAGHRHLATGSGELGQWMYVADTSRDQYTGLFLAYALAWPHLAAGPVRDLVRHDVAAIAYNLMANDLALMSRVEGGYRHQFNLNPWYVYQDRIGPEEWARVDDFPANVFAAAVPFDWRLARALARLRPPAMRGGEALRALLMLGTAARITGDPTIVSFYRDDLVARRQLPLVASATCVLIEEFLAGTNSERFALIAGGVAVALFDVGIEVLDEFGELPRPLARLLGFGVRLQVRAAAERFVVGLDRALANLRRSGGLNGLARWADLADEVASLLGAWGRRRAAARCAAGARWLRQAAGSNLDELVDALRSYVGLNLTFFALTGILETETDPAVTAAARDLVPRVFAPVADEGNALYTYMRVALASGPVSDDILAAARAALADHPLDCRRRRFDHAAVPGLRVLPWPDRFGRIGNQAARPFPLSQRPADVFPWQRDPRQIVSGDDAGVRVAPVGWLLAYWFARAHGLLGGDA